jgi:hypothetical protein
MSGEVLNESGQIIWLYREPQAKSITTRFANFAIEKLTKPKSLRSPEKERRLFQALDTAIANSGKTSDSEANFELAQSNLWDYIKSLYEWGDKEGGRAVIDSMLTVGLTGKYSDLTKEED